MFQVVAITCAKLIVLFFYFQILRMEILMLLNMYFVLFSIIFTTMTELQYFMKNNIPRTGN
jgi:hypothetical protein